METAYYLAGPEVAEKLSALVRRCENHERTARRIAHSFGAKNVYWQGNTVAGFQFKDDPGPRFCRIKGTSDGWRLRRTAENKEMIGRLAVVEKLSTRAVGLALGLYGGRLRFVEGGGRPGFRISGQAGLTVAGKQFIVEVEREDGEPDGCTRISDVERERLIAAAEKKPKRKKTRKAVAH